MADNTFYISTGLIPDDTGDSMTSNTFYISAGLVPDDLDTGGEPTLVPINPITRRSRFFRGAS